MEKRDIIIAIDGHSSTGKSTFARAISIRYGLTYVDTGALYRGVTLLSQREKLNDLKDNKNLTKLQELLEKAVFEFLPTGPNGYGQLYLNGENIEEEIRSIEVAQMVSKVASIPIIREFVDSLLKKYGAKRG
ncbi:MAG: (d)CMP kinase, partial [Bacteroidales bacterium]|nr:(d)CMP kinase [Bacteroidales bacterium]